MVKDIVHPSACPSYVNDEGLLHEELTERNHDYGSPNLSHVSCSTTRGGINRKRILLQQLGAHGPKIIVKYKNLMSRNKDPLH